MLRVFRSIFPLTVIAVLFPFLIGADWPAFKAGATRTSFATESLTPPLELKWSTAGPVNPSPSVRYSSPIVVGNKVYFATNTGDVQAYSLSGSGSANPTLWDFKTSGPIYGSPAWAVVDLQERIFVGSTDGFLYCLDAGSGALVWKKDLGSAVFSSPIVFSLNGSQIVLTGSNDGNVYALKAGDGSTFWSQPFATGGYVFASPVFDAATSRVFVPSYDGNLYSIDAATGNQAWVQNIGPSRITPAVAANRVFSLSNTGFIRAYDTTAGTALGANGVGQTWGAASSPAVVPGSPSTMVFSFDNGNVWALRTQTTSTALATVWLRTLPDKVYSTPTISNGVVYVGCDNGNLYALNLLNGNILQTIALGATAQIAPAIGQGTLLIASGTGQLRAYGMPVLGYKWVGPANPQLGAPTSYAIQAVDVNGNVVPAYSGSAKLSVLVGSGVVFGAPTVAFTAGVAAVTLTFNQPGQVSVRATSTTIPSLHGDLTVNVTATGPRIQVTLTNDKTTVHENDTISYTALLVNVGSSTAPAVRLTLPVPASATFLTTDTTPVPTPGAQVLWDLGDFNPGTSKTVQFMLRADPATIFASDFNIGEISDAWSTTSPKFYVIDQSRVLVTSPNIGGEEAWLHTADSVYRRRLTIDGSVEYLGTNQSTLKFTRNGTTGINDFIRLQTDLGSKTVNLSILGTSRQSAALTSPGIYLYHFELDFETHRIYVRFTDTNSSNPNPTLLEYTSIDPADTPDTTSLYFGVFNNNGALLLDDDIRILDTGRLSTNSVDVQVTAASTTDATVAATSNALSTSILGVPKLDITKSVAPVMSDPRLAMTSNQAVTYKIQYSNTGNYAATNVTVWDTLPTNLSLDGIGLPSGISSVSPPSGSDPGFLGWSIGNLAPGAVGGVTIQAHVKDLSQIRDNAVFNDGFDYGDIAGLLGTWQTTTLANFALNGQSEVVASAVNFESDFLAVRQAVPCGGEMARVTAKLRWLDFGATQFIVSATTSGDNLMQAAVGAGPLVGINTDSNNIYLLVFDNTNGQQTIGPVGTFLPNVDYYLEVVYNRVGREATVNLINSQTGASALYSGLYVASNLGSYPDLVVGFKAMNTSMAVGDVHISREDIDQSASTTSQDFTRKFTSIPHLFGWVEKPVLSFSEYGPMQANVGDALQYSLIVESHGSVTPLGIQVTDILPSNLTYVNAFPAPASVSGNVLTWNIPVLPAYGERTIQLNVTAATAGQAVQNSSAYASNAPLVLHSSWTTNISPIGLTASVKPALLGMVGGGLPVSSYSMTFTSTPTSTFTLSATPTPTFTFSKTSTPTASPSPTYSWTSSPSPTPSWTDTFTPSETPSPTPTNSVSCGGSIYFGSGTRTSMFFDSGNAQPPVDSLGHNWQSVDYLQSNVWTPAVMVTTLPTSWTSPCRLNGQGGVWVAVNAQADPPTLADAYFRDSFTIPSGASVTQGTLVLSGDNIVEAWLNDAYLGRFEGPFGTDSQLYSRCVTVAFDPTAILPGKNVLSFHLINQNTKHGIVYSAYLGYQLACTPVPTATATITRTPTPSYTPTFSPTSTATKPLPTLTPSPTPTTGLSQLALNPLAYPNPSNGGPVNFRVTGGPYEKVTLQLMTLSGRCIRKIEKPVKTATDELFQWDLRDSNGSEAANGLYLARFEAHQAGQVRLKTVKVMVLK